MTPIMQTPNNDFNPTCAILDGQRAGRGCGGERESTVTNLHSPPRDVEGDVKKRHGSTLWRREPKPKSKLDEIHLKKGSQRLGGTMS